MELLIRNLWSQVAGLVGRPRTILKIFYFIGGHQFFQISPGIKSLNDRGRKLIHLLAGRHNLGPGRQFQQIYWRGKPPGRISPGHLDRVYKGTRCITSFWYKVSFLISFWIPYDFYLLSSLFFLFLRWFQKNVSAVLLFCTILLQLYPALFYMNIKRQKFLGLHISYRIYLFFDKYQKLVSRWNFKIHELLFIHTIKLTQKTFYTKYLQKSYIISCLSVSFNCFILSQLFTWNQKHRISSDEISVPSNL